MTPQDYEFLRRLLKARSGLVLSSEKHYLVESRLLPVARKHGLGNLTRLVARLRASDAEPMIIEVVEAMTTNESCFFSGKLPVARKAGLFNLTGLVARLRGPDAEPLIVEVVEAMTTNESFI
jgi:hypothetical protein